MGKESFRDAFYTKAFWEYIVFFLRSAWGCYMEYFGIEMFTICVGIYGDENISASWVSV
jgi:hypothetical protein